MHRLPIALMARSHGADVQIACGQGEGREAIEAAGLPFHRLPLTRAPFAPWSDVRTIGSLVRLYRVLEPDLVHHVTLKPVLFGSIAARLARVPGVINNFAGLGSAFSGESRGKRLRRRIVERGLALAMKLPRQWAVFENEDDRLQLVGARVVSDRETLVIPGIGVDIDEYSPSPEPAGPVRVLMACRMVREKGVFQFVEAARLLKDRGLGARFLLAGAPDAFNPGGISKEQLRVWHQEGTVEWLGFRRDMPQLLSDSHIVCLPSYYREGVPRILIEAASCGRPLVGTDMPGCRDIVRHGSNGFLVPARDAKALALALEKLCTDAALRAEFGAAGRRLVEQGFALPGILKKFRELYASAGLRIDLRESR
jgi:glycosyltransferase involved in cell wall biosynthesis